MSTEICKKIAKNIKFLQSVVIKGFTDEPTKLYFVKTGERATTVLCRDGKTQMDFANDVVYQYDAESFLKLREAFENKDVMGLEKEWQRAKPIVFS